MSRRRHHATIMPNWRPAALLCLLIGLIPGCAQSPVARFDTPATNATATSTHAPSIPGHAPAGKPERQVAFRTGDIPLPPGVEPEYLAPSDDPALATASFADVLAQFATNQSQPADTTAAPEAIDERTALRHYILGRESAHRGEYYRAVLEFERAEAADPASTAILRELARAYLSLRSQSKAVAASQRLVELDPIHGEALFTLGITALDRQDYQNTLATIGLARHRAIAFDHDPAAEFLADIALFTSLEAMGQDRAAVQLAEEHLVHLSPPPPSIYGRRVMEAYRQLGDLWRRAGDAHVRLDDPTAALTAYREASRHSLPDTWILHPRIVYCHARLGNHAEARREVLTMLTRSDASIGERDVRLCTYLNDAGIDIAPLLGEVDSLYAQHPDHGGYARAAAALRPAEDATILLSNFIARRPRDLPAVGELLGWMTPHNTDAAVRLTMELTAQHPDLAREYVEQLLLAAPRLAELLIACSRQPESIARALVHSRLLIAAGEPGRAWATIESARNTWPGDPTLLTLHMMIAGALEEPGLVKSLAEVGSNLERPDFWTATARARRSMNQTELAVQAASFAVSVSDGESYDALIELAESQAVLAQQLSDPVLQRDMMTDAAVNARAAMKISPEHDDAYELLLGIFQPDSVGEDLVELRNILRDLRANSPESPLLARLIAQEAVANGSTDEPINQLIALYDENPAETDTLNTIVSAWIQLKRVDTAINWLHLRLQARPDDPALLNQWARLLLLNGQEDRLIVALEQLRADHPRNFVGRQLLETAYRATGRDRDAYKIALARLNDRPQGVRRSVELAALFAGAGKTDEAQERLRWIVDHADACSRSLLETAVVVSGRMQGDIASLLTLELTEETITRFPEVPLQVYGAGMRALARMRQLDDRFEDLVRRAAASALGVNGSSVRELLPWRELAQAMIDARHARAAQRLLAIRLRAEPALDPDALRLMTRMMLATNAAIEDVDASIAMYRAFHRDGKLAIVGAGPGRATLAETLFEASTVHALAGDDDGSEALLLEALRLNPDHAMAMNNLAYTHIVEGRINDTTIQFVEAAYARDPNDTNILDTIGWLRYRQGHFADEENASGALELVTRAISGQANASEEVYDHLGDIYWRLGDRDRAIKAWKDGLKAAGDAAAVDRMVRNILELQSLQWGLVVEDPRVIYDRQFGRTRERLRDKLELAEQGLDPEIAPTFSELSMMRDRDQESRRGNEE